MKKLLFIPIVVVVLVLGVYELLIVYDNDFPFGRMRETPAVKPHEEPLRVMQDGIVPLSEGEALLRATPGENLTSPLPVNDQVTVEGGRALYGTYCAQCHGSHHDGNGTVGQSFSPLPADLRSQKVQAMPAGVLFKDISYGLPNGRQPPLAATIEAIDRWRIIAYVKSLGTRN